MITYAFLYSASLVFAFFLELLPTTGDLTLGVADAITTIVSSSMIFDEWVPVGTVWACLSIYLTFEFMIFSIRVARWIISFVRGRDEITN